MRTFFKAILVPILMAQARVVVRKYKPRIIAITGSVGKTSTKDAIYAAIAPNSFVRRSEKSFNSEIGLPLTILGVPNAWSNPLRWLQNILDGLSLILFKADYPEWLVLEIGADRPGDIRKIAAWLPVDIAVVTRLPEVPVHVEYFSSPEEVIEEKAAIISALRPGGSLVLYGDDERYRDLAKRLPEGRDSSVITFGFSENAMVRGSGFEILFDEKNRPSGMRGEITGGGSQGSLEIRGTVGMHAFLPAIAAAAVGTIVGRPVSESVHSLKEYEAPIGRMRILEGIKGSTIIDDTYNSSPAAIEAALETLALCRAPAPAGGAARAGRLIAVLGDMLELGRHSVAEHRKAGAMAAKSADILYTVGFRARDIAEGALDNGMSDGSILQFEDSEKAGEELAANLRDGDIVLVKGSQSMRTEKTVELIMAHPERASELLVRQDSEWKKR